TLIDILTVGTTLLPIFTFFLLSFFLFQSLGWKKIIRENLAVTWTMATVAVGMACVAISELASSANQLTPGFCRGAWVLSDLGLTAVAILAFKGRRHEFVATMGAQW